MTHISQKSLVGLILSLGLFMQPASASVTVTPISLHDHLNQASELAKLNDDKVIIHLVNGWMYRDTAQWNKLKSLFSPDATVEVTWFEGKASDFIAASQKWAKLPFLLSTLSVRRLLANTVIKLLPKPTL